MLFYLIFNYIFDVCCGTRSVVCDDLSLYDRKSTHLTAPRILVGYTNCANSSWPSLTGK